MKADGTCGDFLATGIITEPRTRYGSVIECRTIGLYQEDPWEDAGCQMACSVCTACDLTVGETPAPTPSEFGAHPCGEKMAEFDTGWPHACKPNDKGWANVDMDSITGGYEAIKNDADITTKISLTYSTKAAHEDVDKKN